METIASARIYNEAILERIEHGGPEAVKTAADDFSEYVRLKLREKKFSDKIIPETTVGSSDLERVLETDKPVMIYERESESVAAVSVGFGRLPSNLYINATKFLVKFDRILSRQFQKDIVELHTYKQDLRQIVSDNATKDIDAEIDTKFIAAVDKALIAPGAVCAWSGEVQWETQYGGITRESLVDALNVTPRNDSSLEPEMVLVNNITAKETSKWDRIERGGDDAQKVFRDGVIQDTLFGVQLTATIKRDLVPTNSMYTFPSPKYMGVSHVLEDTTMYINRKAFLLEWFLYRTQGATIAHAAGISRTDFR